MTTSVKERLKTDLEQAQKGGKQRAAKISDILKSAASMTVEEIKEGSADLHVLTRKSLVDLLEELHVNSDEVDVAAAATAPIADADAANEAPTWPAILKQALAIVRDRKGDWLQEFKAHWQKNAAKFDNDMTDEYGDRYRKTKSVFRQVFDWVKSQSTGHQTQSQPSRPVTVEVVDGDDAAGNAAKAVNSLDAE
ncbi:MAG: hypothetical protein AAGA01_00190 [Cyanobacteria bacterium P01_E01_bin.43]